MQFKLAFDSLADGTDVGEGTSPINSLGSDDPSLYHANNNEIFDAMKVARQARRKEQNRAA